MSERLQRLKARKAELIDAMQVMIGEAEAEDRGLDEEEEAKYAEMEAQLAETKAAIEAEDRSLERRRVLSAERHGLDEPAQQAVAPRVQLVRDHEADRPFASFGEQLAAIASAGMNRGADRDPRLIWAAATGAGEAVPSEGGFLVQRDFSMTLLELMHELGEVVRRCRDIPISANANGIKLPTIDETSRANGSRWGGVLAYWADEAAAVTASQPKFGRLELDLKKLMGIGYATEEILRDSTALETVMRQAFAEEMVFKTEDAIINGTGAGMPLGILNAGSLVTVAKESGQANATVVTANVLNMHSRMPARHRRNSVWLINQIIEPQLYTLALPNTTGSLIMLYRPPGSNDQSGVASFGTMLGRPVIPVEYCGVLGAVGDIMFVDLSQYICITKGGVRADQSMHVRFVYDEMTFRFVYRIDGQPGWKQPVTAFDGTNTYSPFVTLAARSS